MTYLLRNFTISHIPSNTTFEGYMAIPDGQIVANDIFIENFLNGDGSLELFKNCSIKAAYKDAATNEVELYNPFTLGACIGSASIITATKPLEVGRIKILPLSEFSFNP